MPKIVFTSEELATYFAEDYKSDVMDISRERETDMRVHADGIYPEKIIDAARPHESDAVKEYRKSIWKAKTKPTFSKVFSSLSKIRRSSDWVVQFPEEGSAKVPDGESFEEYVMENYPKFESVENWIFKVLLREYLIDANAVCVVFPGAIPEEVTEFRKPVSEIYNSCHVIIYRAEDFTIIKNPLGATFTENGRSMQGDSYFVITTQDYLRYDQINSKRQFALKMQETHNLGYMPVWKLGGVLTKTYNDELLYESRLAGMLPEMDEAVREYSDLQAAVIMNIYPERWEMAAVDCTTCNGTGKIQNREGGGGFSECGDCHGYGAKPVSPFSKVLVKPAEVGQQMPIPPAGYIEKDAEIVKLQDERVKQHIYEALAAVNMEFLADTPLSESGVAKEVDRDETNNFVHSVAEDIVMHYDLILYYIARLRYGVQHSEEEIEAMLPTVAVPEHFDIFSVKYDEEELTNAKTNKINPVLVNAMEVSYATKKFNAEPMVMKKLVAVLMLDPLANISEEDKMVRLSNKGITQDSYVLSSNIVSFIERAMQEDENFLSLEPDKQAEILDKYVQEVVTATTMAGELESEFNADEEDEEEETVPAANEE